MNDTSVKLLKLGKENPVTHSPQSGSFAPDLKDSSTLDLLRLIGAPPGAGGMNVSASEIDDVRNTLTSKRFLFLLVVRS